MPEIRLPSPRQSASPFPTTATHVTSRHLRTSLCPNSYEHTLQPCTRTFRKGAGKRAHSHHVPISRMNGCQHLQAFLTPMSELSEHQCSLACLHLPRRTSFQGCCNCAKDGGIRMYPLLPLHHPEDMQNTMMCESCDLIHDLQKPRLELRLAS